MKLSRQSNEVTEVKPRGLKKETKRERERPAVEVIALAEHVRLQTYEQNDGQIMEAFQEESPIFQSAPLGQMGPPLVCTEQGQCLEKPGKHGHCAAV